MKKVYIDLEQNRKLFFTSDLHFGHENVIKFCNRPYTNAKEMRVKLIENWNSVVSNDDYAFILGDVFWFNHSKEMKRTFDKLNGKKIYVVPGNHDDFNSYLEKYGDAYDYLGFLDQKARIQILTCDEVTLYVEGLQQKEYYLSHCPMMTWPHRERGVPNFFGHIHSGPRSNNEVDNNLPLWPLQYDVGVDNNEYTPIEIRDIIKKLTRVLDSSES